MLGYHSARTRGKPKILAMAALLLALAAAAALQPAQADAAIYIDRVSDEKFAADGYEWHLDFTGVESESGWMHSPDLVRDVLGDNSNQGWNWDDIAKSGEDGWVAWLDSGATGQTLRLTGGSYSSEEDGDVSVDALVTIKGYTAPASAGSVSLAEAAARYHGMATRPVVAYNPHWSQAPEISHTSAATDALTNLNLFCVGLSDLDVEVRFVRSGTDEPVRVAGHMTCIDLDENQAFSFYGGVIGAEVSKWSSEEYRDPSDYDDTYIKPTQNPRVVKWINIIHNTLAKAASTTIPAISNDSGSEQLYNRGLVGGYFDTGEDGTDAIGLHFETSWALPDSTQANGYKSTPMSFFAMTPEYVANPPKTGAAGAKISKSTPTAMPVAEGDGVYGDGGISSMYALNDSPAHASQPLNLLHRKSTLSKG